MIRCCHSLDEQMVHGLHIPGRVLTRTSRPASDRGTKKRVPLHSALLPCLCVPSLFHPGQAQETQREIPVRRYTKEGSSARRGVLCDSVLSARLFTELYANKILSEHSAGSIIVFNLGYISILYSSTVKCESVNSVSPVL